MYAEEFVAGLKEEKARALLVALIEALDEVDGDDALGTEGWRRYLRFSGKIPESN